MRLNPTIVRFKREHLLLAENKSYEAFFSQHIYEQTRIDAKLHESKTGAIRKSHDIIWVLQLAKKLT